MLSSLYVAASMPPFVETKILDEDVELINFDTDADLIGVSFMTYNAPRAYEIADIFRKKKGKPVIFGGYHPTFMREEAIQHADAICIGEAERSVPRMIDDFRNGNLRPFYEEPLDNLRGLPVPNRTLVTRQAYAMPDAVQATRGCPFRCKFCSITSFFKNRFRVRPVDEVVEELRHLGRYILFMDDNIIADGDHAKELFAKMIPLRKRWFSQCSIRLAYDEELLRLAYASGCRGLFIGLESLSQESLKGWNKKINRASDYTWAMDKLHNTGIAVIAGIVFGDDFDSPEIFRRTLEFLEEANIEALQATILTPMPGTPLFEELDRDGRILDKEWSKYDFRNVVFEPKQMSPQTLKKGHDWVLTRFYSQRSILKRLSRSFGYLSPWVVFKATAPLNISYRSRLSKDGTFDSVRSKRNGVSF